MNPNGASTKRLLQAKQRQLPAPRCVTVRVTSLVQSTHTEYQCCGLGTTERHLSFLRSVCGSFNDHTSKADYTGCI